MMHGTVCVLIQYIEKKSTFYFSNYEGFDECMYGTCGVQYLQQGEEPLPHLVWDITTIRI